MKVFRVSGEIRKPKLESSFDKEVIAVKRSHAVEKIYSELGSRHRVKRFHIDISNVEEVPPEEIKDPSLKELVVRGKEVV